MKTNDHCAKCQSSSAPLSIRLEPFPIDERISEQLRSIKNTCDLLAESRFGPGRFMPMVYHFGQTREADGPIFYDMTDAGPVPSYSILPDSEIARRYAFAAVADAMQQYGRRIDDSPQLEKISASVQNSTPLTLARGSPSLTGMHSFSSTNGAL